MSKKKKSVLAPAPPVAVEGPGPLSGYHAQKNYSPGSTGIVMGDTYKRRHTLVITPSLGRVPVRWVQAKDLLMHPMNAKFHHMYLVNQEVGKAYEQAVDIIRANAEFASWDYVLTLEDDNLPPPDGLLKLCEDMEANKQFDIIGGLYFTKGEGGQPMAYGKPSVMPKDFVPWLPPPDAVTECNGLGMGFTLYRMKLWLDKRLDRPLFSTEQNYTPGVGIRAYTQDLRMAEIVAKHGYRHAISTRVLVGHYDWESDRVW